VHPVRALGCAIRRPGERPLALLHGRPAGHGAPRLHLRRPQANQQARRSNLRENGATEEEIKFLIPENGKPQRVELNAFTSDALIAWIEAKLAEHGVRKVIPDEETLAHAYRRAHEACVVQGKIDDLVAEIRKNPTAIEVPAGLRARIETAFKANPALPWDAVIASIVKKDIAK
jgi:hypothetical protein